jgi:hypothetical protein
MKGESMRGVTGPSGGRQRARATIACALSSFVLVACTLHDTRATDEVVPTCPNPAPLDKSEAALPGRFIVVLKDHVRVDDFACRIAAQDVKITAKMSRMRMVGVNASPAAIARLRCDVDVKAVSPDEPTIAN